VPLIPEDADDISMPNRLKLQVDFLDQKQDISGIGSFVYEIKSTGQKIRTVNPPVKDDQVKCSTLFTCSVVHSSAMIRRDFFINNHLFYDETFPCSQDFEMWSRAVFLGKICNIPQYLILYRCSETQMSFLRKDIQLKQAQRVYKSLLNRLGIEVTEKELELHSIFATHKRFNSQKNIPEIFSWAELLYKKNYETKVFNTKVFAHEILLRFLRFCIINKVGFLKTIRLQVKLHCHMKKIYFPYHLLFRRLSKTYKNTYPDV
jgi:hypothetical protein